MLTINGQSVDAAGKTVAEYLAEAGYNTVRIAVERNEEIVPKAKYAETVLADGDVVEVEVAREDGDDLVAVYLVALVVDEEAAIAVAIESNAEVEMVFGDEVF